MRKILLHSFLAAILFLSTAISPLNFYAFSKPLPTSKISKNFNDDEKEIFELVNRERRKKNLTGLKWRSDLSEMARKYSEKMAREKFFSHFDKSGSGVTERARASKIKGWFKIGENLFYYESKENLNSFVVKKWMESSSHRANILDRDYTSAGLGIAQSRDGKVFITQVFVKD